MTHIHLTFLSEHINCDKNSHVCFYVIGNKLGKETRRPKAINSCGQPTHQCSAVQLTSLHSNGDSCYKSAPACYSTPSVLVEFVCYHVIRLFIPDRIKDWLDKYKEAPMLPAKDKQEKASSDQILNTINFNLANQKYSQLMRFGFKVHCIELYSVLESKSLVL